MDVSEGAHVFDDEALVLDGSLESLFSVPWKRVLGVVTVKRMLGTYR